MAFAKAWANRATEEFDCIHNGQDYSQLLVFSSLSTFLRGRDRDNNIGAVLPFDMDSTGEDSRLNILVGSNTKNGVRVGGISRIRAAHTDAVNITCVHGTHDLIHLAIIPTELSAIGA